MSPKKDWLLITRSITGGLVPHPDHLWQVRYFCMWMVKWFALKYSCAYLPHWIGSNWGKWSWRAITLKANIYPAKAKISFASITVHGISLGHHLCFSSVKQVCIIVSFTYLPVEVLWSKLVNSFVCWVCFVWLQTYSENSYAEFHLHR